MSITNINIIKRDNRKEKLDITKIQKMTIDAVHDLENVSQSELEIDAQIKFIDGMKSSDIQDALIRTAVEKIDIDRPHWTFVAARLFLYDLYHKVGLTLSLKYGNRKGQRYRPLKEYIENGIQEGRIIPNLAEGYDLDDLHDYIKPERDFLFNYLGIKTLYDRYLIKDKNNSPIELPQQMFMGIAMFLAQDETNKQQCAKEFYDVISKFEVMLATPTLSNARTNRHQLSSCYIGSAPDNIEGIFDSYSEMSLLSKFGGGIGWDWNQIRSLGGVIDNHKNAAGGSVPFFKITNDIAIAVDQLGCVSRNSFVEVLSEVVIGYNSNNTKVINMLDAESNHEKIKFNTSIDFDIDSYIEDLLDIYEFPMKKYNRGEIETAMKIYLTTPRKKGFVDKFKKILNISHDSARNLSKCIYKYLLKCNIVPEGYKEVKYSDDLSNYICNEYGVIRTKDGFCLLNQSAGILNHLQVSMNNASYPAHRIIYFTWSGSKNYANNVDHKDNNKFNNHFSNLQELTHEQNLSKGWKETDIHHRVNKNRIRKHLIYNYELNGHKTIKNKNNMEVIEIKEYIYKKLPFKDVKVGMLAKSFNITTGKIEPKLIEKVYDLKVQPENQISLNYEDGSYTITSLWHPTLVYRNNEFIYIRADEVIPGDIGVGGNGNLVKYIKSTSPNIDPSYMDLTVKDNNNYFCVTDNIENDTHVIHNTRKGAIAVYMEPWHADILDFLDLKKNSGEERRRAHDLFPALWITDLFMERILEDGQWTLFDPYDTPDLSECFGDEFKEKYIAYENSDIKKNTMKAKDLWKKVLTSYYESGSPFLCFKDTANKANPNSHIGHIRSSNLCTEIFQNTNPNHYKIKVEFEDGSILTFEEDDLIMVKDGSYKKGNKVTALDHIRGIVVDYEDNNPIVQLLEQGMQRVFIVEKEKIDGDTAVCNLASINLSRINTKYDIERVVPIAVRMLDNVIDLNFYPLRKVKMTNLKTRAIGLGVMGEAEMLATHQIHWGSQEHIEKIDNIMECISYNTILTSTVLGQTKGNYKCFEGSNWSKGIMPHDHTNSYVKELTTSPKPTKVYSDALWNQLRERTKMFMRNGYLMAIAPTSSISILVGTTQAIEPVYKRKWFEENLSGLIPVVVPQLSPDTWQYYTPAFEVDQLQLIKVAAIRQKWIDQGQSTNIFMSLDKASGKHLHEIYTLAHKLGCKSTYYLRGQSADAKKAENTNNVDIADRSIECDSCQ